MADCLDKLRELLLEVATTPRHRTPTRSTRGSIERRLKAKKNTSSRKQSRQKPAFED